MFLPPTALPNRLRLLVDPPLDFPAAREDASQPIAASRRPRFALPFRASRATRPAHGPAEPCPD
jgi:hypothetical protein